MSDTQYQYTPLQRTYATALFGAARRLGILQRAQEEAKLLLRIVRHSPRLLLFMESPHVNIQDKLALLDRVFKGRLSPLLINLLHVLANRRRTTHLDEILEIFEQLVEEAEGIFSASVTSAYELSFQDKLKLKGALEKHTARRLKIDYRVDLTLIGGIVFRFGDLLIDGSLRNGLNELGQRLLQAQPVTAGG